MFGKDCSGVLGANTKYMICSLRILLTKSKENH